MAVNLKAPRPEDLLPVKGVRLGVAEAGIRRSGRKDLLLIVLAVGAIGIGAFIGGSIAQPALLGLVPWHVEGRPGT